MVRLSRTVVLALESVHFLLCREELEGKAKGIDIFHEDWCEQPLG